MSKKLFFGGKSENCTKKEICFRKRITAGQNSDEPESV